jgi:lactoylglutathione lyase
VRARAEDEAADAGVGRETSMRLRRTGIILFTENYDKCVDFYTRALALPVLFAVEGEHSKLTCCDMNGQYLMIETGGVAVAGVKNRQQSPAVLRFNVEDVDACAAELEQRGVRTKLRKESWGTIADFADPDGNRCQLRDERTFAELIGT